MSDETYELKQSPRCPSCQAELEEGAVLCVSCGYHLEKGTRLTTKRKKKKEGTRTPKPVLGFLHAGNALVLCGGFGCLLGILLALILGNLYGSRTGFEMGFNLFAGIVLGTAIGGGIGYVLASMLPQRSSASVSEQLNAGLFRVIGGFVLCGIGLVSFFVFRDMEATGSRGPQHMFKIAIALYELTGKWGVLLIICGCGIAMIVLGVRAMLPRDA